MLVSDRRWFANGRVLEVGVVAGELTTDRQAEGLEPRGLRQGGEGEGEGEDGGF